MPDNNRAGDLHIGGGNAGPWGSLGNVNISGGNFSGGSASQQNTVIKVGDMVRYLTPIIQANPDISEEKKKTLIQRLIKESKDVKTLAAFAQLLFTIFGG